MNVIACGKRWLPAVREIKRKNLTFFSLPGVPRDVFRYGPRKETAMRAYHKKRAEEEG
jgi:hypothetical protein